MQSGPRRLIIFALLFAWCAALYALRMKRAHDSAFSFVPWNMLLAAIPAIAAAIFVRAHHGFVLAMTFIVWLLFLPNAPYLITDFVHLEQRPYVPLWFDIALLGSCAATGLLLAYTSTADVQVTVTRRFGKVAGWSVAIGALLLSGFGIYLGRFLRWNSWDPVQNPRQMLEVAEVVPHTRTIAVTFVYGVGVTLGYVALRTIGATLPRERWQR